MQFYIYYVDSLGTPASTVASGWWNLIYIRFTLAVTGCKKMHTAPIFQ